MSLRKKPHLGAQATPPLPMNLRALDRNLLRDQGLHYYGARQPTQPSSSGSGFLGLWYLWFSWPPYPRKPLSLSSQLCIVEEGHAPLFLVEAWGETKTKRAVEEMNNLRETWHGFVGIDETDATTLHVVASSNYVRPARPSASTRTVGIGKSAT